MVNIHYNYWKKWGFKEDYLALQIVVAKTKKSQELDQMNGAKEIKNIHNMQ